MVDLLGFGTVAQGVTTRPTDARTLGGDDTWAKPCSSPSAGDGTKVDPDWANILLAQLRRAIRGMGVTENNADDDMLLKAIQAAASGCVTIAQGRMLPIYPHVASGTLSVSASGGNVVIATGQTFLHRGVFQYSTDLYSGPQRTFATLANKTYHLRWAYASGSSAFYLRDLADSGYNPSALQETDTSFDTGYDDMLIAKVVTNGSNVATITPLSNKAFLALSSEQNNSAAAVSWSSPVSYKVDYAVTVNWARTPAVRSLVASLYNASSGTTGRYVGGGSQTFVTTANRYLFAFTVGVHWHESVTGMNVSDMQGKGYCALAA